MHLNTLHSDANPVKRLELCQSLHVASFLYHIVFNFRGAMFYSYLYFSFVVAPYYIHMTVNVTVVDLIPIRVNELINTSMFTRFPLPTSVYTRYSVKLFSSTYCWFLFVIGPHFSLFRDSVIYYFFFWKFV